MPVKRKEEEKVDDDVESNTSSSVKTIKRLRNSIKSSKQEPVEPAQPSQTLKANTSSSSSDRQTRNKSLLSTAAKQSAAQIEKVQYYEDFFDIICSYQDDTQRYLANIFYVLPSRKVFYLQNSF